MTHERNRFYIISILILAALLRFSGLGLSEFHGDEVMITGRSIALCKIPSNPINLGIVLVHIHPPIEILLPVPFLLSLGVTELTARLPFAIAGIVSIYLVYRIAGNLFSSRIGILSATLLCFNGYHVMFSRIVMATSIELMLILLAMLLLIEATDNPCDLENRKWTVLGLGLGVCLLTQYHTLLLFPVVIYFLRERLGSAWWREESIKKILIGLLVVAAPFYFVYFSAPLFFSEIGPSLGFNYILSRGLGELGFHGTYFLKSLINYCSVFYLSLVTLGLVLSLRFLGDLKVRLCWIWLLSFWVPFLFFMRSPVVVYVMDGIPPLLILASKGLVSLIPDSEDSPKRRKGGKILLVLLVCLVILLSSFHIYQYDIRLGDVSHPAVITFEIQGSHYRPYKSGWKAAGWFIRENTKGSDLFVSDGEGFVTRYYTNRRYLCEIQYFFDWLNSSKWSEVKFIILSAESIDRFPSIWSYVVTRYFLAAIVRSRSIDSIFIYSTETVDSSPEFLYPQIIDRLFDAKYGKSTETILSIYV